MSTNKTVKFLSKNAYLKLVCIYILSLTFSGCATNVWEKEAVTLEQRYWLESIITYQESPLVSERNLGAAASLLAISDEMYSFVKQKFPQKNKNIAVEKLARWLMSPDGHNMKYDFNANLTPIEAFEQKRGNCLSFTILLVNLAKVIDVELEYNDVYLPNFWGMEDDESNVVLLRHINAIRKTHTRTQIFDLAIEQYDYGFPQDTISENHAAAWLYSNLSVQYLNNHDLENAFHNIKLAISLVPNNPDFWINLGAIYKNNNQFINSERAFLHALNLGDSDSLAASNLEKLYRQQEMFDKAAYFKKKALYAQRKNPYHHYSKANTFLQLGQFNLAKKSITRAKKLHNQDHRFYLLSSIIEQNRKNYSGALKDILTAHSLSANNDKQQYSEKAQLLAIKIKNTLQNDNVSESLLNTHPDILN